ncbi:MAG: S9 family peptidase [Chlorobi bacterium]|nr:S9 family peptidase [Chlorobiota bacterium]MCI0715299.1 S9 family peptidase [Chlorobiota bacterium]
MTSLDKPKEYRVEQFFAIRQISGLSLSPNGKTIAYITNTNGLPNIWTIPIEGGWTSQITLEENAVRWLSYSPKKKELIFQSDFNGDENLQLFLVAAQGGEVKYITPAHKGSQVQFCCWNKKGTKILYCSNKRKKGFFDTYIYDFETEKEECINECNDLYPDIASAWSKNERYILFVKFYNNSNQDVFLFDIETKTRLNISEHKGSMKNFGADFNKKADTVYFLSDYEREFLGLAYYKVKSGEIGWLILENWDITNYSLSESGKFILYSINENGSTRLKLKNLKSNKTKSLKLPKGNCLWFDFTPDEKKIVLVYDSPQNPNDIYVYDIKKEKLKQITFSMIGGIPKNEFIVPQEVKYKSFDGLEISAYLYIPKWMKKVGSNPVIVWPHGGPEWQEKNIFNKYFQILANRGYIVIAPNFRGSTGYGKSFQKMIYKDWGGAEFKDVLGAYDYLVNSGYADKSKIAVVGGSFGGFMTLTCVTKAPELWRCAVDIFGPSNLVTFQESIPEHWKPGVVELIGDPEKDKELLNDRSPINFVDNIRCPIFIVQGKHDPRVVQAESDQIVEKLRSQNKTVEYMVLEDEGHGFSKVPNQIKVWEMICSFLDKQMK